MPIAALIGPLLSAGGSIAGGIMGSNAAGDAASAQMRSANSATGINANIAKIIQDQLRPFLQTGTNAGSILGSLYGAASDGNPNPTGEFNRSIGDMYGPPPTATNVPQLNSNIFLPIDQFHQSPGYQYLLDQQQRAIQQSGAGKSGAVSGNMLQALQTNAAGLADQDYGHANDMYYKKQTDDFSANNQNYWNTLAQSTDAWKSLVGLEQNRRSNITGALTNLSGSGQNAAAQMGGFGTTLGSNVNSNIIGGGNAQASGIIGSSNALSNGFNGAINSLFPSFGVGGGNSGGGGNFLNYLFGGGGGDPFGSGAAAYSGSGAGPGSDIFSAFGFQ